MKILQTRFKALLSSSHLLVGVLALALSVISCRGAVASVSPLVAKAREQIGVTTSYDPSYKKLAYPGGDVAPQTGVCSDVVVRAFRKLGVDLQKEVHEDMAKAFSEYPQKWGLKRPDANIDHRRVPNLMTYFQRRGWTVEARSKASDFMAGDVVAWDLGGGVTHVGLISDRSSDGTPLVIHNIGSGAKEEDILLRFKVIGHYRPVLSAQTNVSSKVGGATSNGRR
jgi:uncharacterized protein YijF (DUF1287 family)